MGSLTSAGAVFVANKAIEGCRAALAKANAFSTDFSDEAVAVGTTMKVPFFGAGTAEAFDASSANYEHATGAVSYVSMTFGNHYKSTFEFTDKEALTDNIQAGGFWQKAGVSAGRDVAQKISDTIVGLITKTNIPKTGAGSAANESVFTTVTKATVAGLGEQMNTLGVDPSRTNLLLNPAKFYALLSLLDANVYGGDDAIKNGVIPGLYGFANVLCVNNFSTGSGENLVGAIVPQDALLIGGRTVPVLSPSAYEETGTQTDADSGLTLGIRRHGSAAKGTNFLTVEAVFGAALVQASKCCRLVSEAT